MTKLAAFETAPTNTFLPISPNIRHSRLIVVVFPHPGGPLMNVIWFDKTLFIAYVWKGVSPLKNHFFE